MDEHLAHRVHAEVLDAGHYVGVAVLGDRDVALPAKRPDGIGDGRDIRVAPGLYDDRLFGDGLIAVVGELELDRRHRVLVHLDCVDAKGAELRRRRAGLELGVVRPPVAVGIEHFVIDIRRNLVLLDEVSGLPKIPDAIVIREDLADVELVEAIEVVRNVPRVHAEGVVRREFGYREHLGEQILDVVGEAIAICVRYAVASLEVVLPGEVVGYAVSVAVHVPGIGRIVAAVVLMDVRELVAVVIHRPVVEDPRADDLRARLHRKFLSAAMAEHHVELPAVGDAVEVVVAVERLERILRPLALDIDVVLAAKPKRLEIADDEILVERRELLRVDGGAVGECNGVRGQRIEAELVVHLPMDKHDLAGRHLDDAVRRAGRRLELHLGAAPIAALDAVARDDGVVVRHVERVPVDGVAFDRRPLTVLQDVVDGIGAIGVPNRHDRAVLLDKGHNVAFCRLDCVIEVRVEVGELDFPAVGHSVAVGIPDCRLGGVARLFLVEKAVAVRVAGGGGGRANVRVFKAVGDLVAVDVGVLDEDHDLRRLASQVELVGHRDATRSVDRQLGGADVVGISPRLVNVTATVVVRVDVGHQVNSAGLDARERRVDRVDVVDVVELRHVSAQLRKRLAGEVGRPVDFDDDLAFWRLARAEIAYDRAALAVANRQLRVAVLVCDVHLELGPFAPARVRRAVLGVHQRHAPEIVAAVHEDGGAVRRDRVVHIQLRRERAAEGADRRRDAAWQRTDAGVVDDVGRVSRRRNLQAERRHRLVGRRERERRRRAVDGRYKRRRHGCRLDALRVERVYERR